MDGNDGEAFPNILQKEVGGTDRNYTVYVGGTTGHFSGSSSFSGVGSTAASTTDVMDGTWHYVVYRVDGVNLSAFVDGAQEGTATASGTIDTAPGTPLYIAQGTRWDGRIDEIKLFSRALSDNEIKAEYDAGVAGHASGLSFATSIVPGISQTSGYDAIVHTDASNYNLAVSQNQNLTKGGDTIAAVSGSIGTPVSWVEATTKGLGFTLYGTNATAIPGKWSSGNAYAAFPGSATSYYLRSGTQSTKDVLNMRLRLDVPTSQVSGTYTNTITTTGTITP